MSEPTTTYDVPATPKQMLTLERLNREVAAFDLTATVGSAAIADMDAHRLGPCASLALTEAYRDFDENRTKLAELNAQIAAAT
jgi:hypothetical protein